MQKNNQILKQTISKQPTSNYEKVTGGVKGFLADDTKYYAVLLIVVAVSSYTLGLLSHSTFGSTEETGTVVMTPPPVNEVIETQNMPEIKPETPLPEVKAAATESQKVYVASKNSNKFHLPDCPGAQRIKEENKIWFSSKDEARAAGYAPAANCDGL